MIDPKELRPMRLDEMKHITPNVAFYLKNEAGVFERCQLQESHYNDPMTKAMMLHDIEGFIRTGRLYVNLNTALREIIFIKR